jgi:Nucleotidyl transferase AbiEii toxin, Type IV TA system
VTGRYRNAAALRRALEDRLKQWADDTGTDLARHRRLVVFDRLATRLGTDPRTGWILKGGAVMEFRLRSRARTTKDMDLAACPDGGPWLNGAAVRELLIDAVTVDADGDGFRFQVSPPTELSVDVAGRAGWRFSVEAQLAGRRFATVRVDVVARGEEISRTERLPLPNTLAFAGTPQRDIEAVDRHQHFAEKLHAFTRDYGDRPNTRVKDLVDLVLLIEGGVEADATVADAVRHVFAVRATHAVPDVIPDPPPVWSETYPQLAEGLTETPAHLDAALGLLRSFWAKTHENSEAHSHGKDRHD